MSSSRYPLYSSVVLVFFLVRGYGERTKLFPETAIVIEHKTLQLDCFYEDGDPKQSRACQWSKNGVHDIVAIIDENCFVINLFPDIYNFKCTNRTVTTMFINSTDRTLHNTTFSCSFIVGSVTTTGTSTVRVIVPVSSVRLTEPGTDVVITTENSKVTFICNASAAHPRPSITWNSDSRTSFDYSDDVEILKNISVRSDYDGYLYTVMSTLTFYPTKNDNGSSIYCNATNTETQNITSTNKALLNVQYPPTTPIFFTLSNVPLNNVAIIINNALTIRCKSIGNPFPSYIWTTPQKKEVSGEELNIENIQKVDDGTYSCMAYSVFATEGINRNYSLSASIQVTVLFPPDSPKFYYITPATTEQIDNSTINVVNGDDVSVLCNSSGKPHPVSVWNGPTPSDTLSLKSVRVDVKNTCTSSNVMTESAGKTRNGSNSRELNILVLYPPDTPVIKNVLSEDRVEVLDIMSVIENSKMVLECSAKSMPHSTFTWSRSMTGNINLSKQLTVNRIKRNQSGTYTCLAKNEMIRSFGNKETGNNNRSIYIDVLYKAAIKYFNAADFENNNNIMTVDQSADTQIICKVESNPFPNTTIFFKGRLVNEAIRSDTITYNLINSTCSDAGRYICKGKNEYTYEADASTELFLYVKCLPQPSADQPPVKNVSAALTDSAVFLFHAAPYYDPGIIEFRWFKQENGWRFLLRNGTKAYITSSDIHSVLRIVDVSEADYGMYILEYKNSVGMNNFTFYLQQKNQTEEIFKGTDTNYLPMVIGIFTAVLVIVGITLGIVIYIWRCQRKTDNGNKSDDNICGMNTTSGETNSINCESVYEGLKPMDERGYVEMKEQAYAILKPKGSVDTKDPVYTNLKL